MDSQRVEVPAIYCRVSTKGQEQDGTSLETQEAACRTYCEERGWPVDEALIFRDTFSGARLYERPALTELRGAIAAGRCSVLVCYAVDRLSREQHHLGLIVSETEHHGVRLASVTEDWDNTPMGKFLRGATAFAAELERAKILERTTRGRLQRVRDGKPLGGKRPSYGYQWNADHSAYVEHPAEAPVVRRIFADLAAGASLRGLANMLTREHVPIPWPTEANQTTWDHTTLYRIARTSHYWGQPTAFRHGVDWRTKKDKHTNETRRYRAIVLKPTEEHEPLPTTGIPALVDAEIAEIVRERFAVHRAHHGPRSAYPMQLLQQGFGYCGLCGGPLAVHHSRGRQPAYKCSRKLSNRGHPCGDHSMCAPDLDAEVWEMVAQALEDPTIITRELAAQTQKDTTAADLAALERRLAEIVQQQANLARVAAQLEDADAAAPLLANLAALATQKRTLEAERDEVAQRATERATTRERLRELEEWCAVVATNARVLTMERKRDALLALNLRVMLYPSDRVPRWEAEGEIPLSRTFVANSVRMAPPSMMRAASRAFSGG